MAQKKKKKQQQQHLSPERYIVERARGLEIGKCYASNNWQETGRCIAVITRMHKQGNITAGFYMLDTDCLGVKDTFFEQNITPGELEDLLYNYEQGAALVEVSYNEAHNLIYSALEWAQDAGIDPHKNWAITQYILEEDNDDIPLIDYEMGHEGKYLFAPMTMQEFNRFMPIPGN